MFCVLSSEYLPLPIALFPPVNIYPQFYKSLVMLTYTAASGPETRLIILKDF